MLTEIEAIFADQLGGDTLASTEPESILVRTVFYRACSAVLESLKQHDLSDLPSVIWNLSIQAKNLCDNAIKAMASSDEVRDRVREMGDTDLLNTMERLRQ